MRVLKSKPMILLLLSFIAFATGCGKSNGKNSATNRQFGYGNGYNNGYGLPGGGCAPIQPGMPIPFTLNGAIFDSANLVANPGQAMIGGGGGGLGNYVLAGQGPDASAQISIQRQNLLAVGPMPVVGQGMVMISALRYQVMLQRMGVGYGGGFGGMYPQMGYGTGYPTGGMMPQMMPQICASGIVINIGHYENRLYGGKISLVMSGGQLIEDLFF